MHPMSEGHPDYELLFSVLGSLRLDNEKRSIWIPYISHKKSFTKSTISLSSLERYDLVFDCIRDSLCPAGNLQL